MDHEVHVHGSSLAKNGYAHVSIVESEVVILLGPHLQVPDVTVGHLNFELAKWSLDFLANVRELDAVDHAFSHVKVT